MSDTDFDRSYFEADDQTRGYVYEGYRNYACHYKTAEIIHEYCLKHKYHKLLEIGSCRGYVAKILEAKGLDVTGIDISNHCYHTRVIPKFYVHDITDTPFFFPDKSFNLIYSIAVLEHIPENKIPSLIREINRLSDNSLHGITFTSDENDLDDTHQTIRPKEWWIKQFRKYAPEHNAIIMDKEELEKPPYPIPGDDGLQKLNLGSYINMFYYGWTNIDILDLKVFADRNAYIFRQHDLRKPLPYNDNTVDMIFTSHTLEHLSDEEGLQLLRECYRTLKPGGIIRIAVPDTELLVQEYLAGTIKQYSCINKGVENAITDIDALNELLWSGHKTIYDEDKLKHYLNLVGFKEISRTTPFHSRNKIMEKQTYISHPTISLVVEAIK